MGRESRKRLRSFLNCLGSGRMYGFRSFRRRHVLLILVATILLIFVTKNTHAVHHLRRLDIESIDWNNYEDDIISHVKEELNAIVEDPESFLKSRDNLEKSTKVESTKFNEPTSSTSKTSSTSTKLLRQLQRITSL